MSLLRSFFGTPKQSKETAVQTSLELVTYAASLASNPDDISRYLDKVRDITARLGAAPPPGSKDESALLEVYLQLETYLTTKEPIRTFTASGLRKRLAAPLLAQLAKQEQASTVTVKT